MADADTKLSFFFQFARPTLTQHTRMAAPAPQAAMVSMADLNAALKAMLVPMLKDAQEPLLARMDKFDARLARAGRRLDLTDAK